MIKAYADVSSQARGLNFSLDLDLHPYFVCSSSKGSEPTLLTDAIELKSWTLAYNGAAT